MAIAGAKNTKNTFFTPQTSYIQKTNLPKPSNIWGKTINLLSILKEKDPKKLMTVGLVLSIIGLCTLPILNVLALTMCILGVTLGFMGIMMKRNKGEKDYGIGVAALTIGGIPILLAVLGVFILGIFILTQEPIFF